MPSRSKIVAGVAGAAATFGAGVAIAAIFLQTDVTGQASVIQGSDGTRNAVTVEASAVNGSQLNCSDIAVSPDFKTLTFNPVLTKPANGSNATNAPVPGGECTVKVAVENTGTKPITIDGASGLTAFPRGWNASDFQIPSGSIAPGKSQTIAAKIVATQGAEAGPISGKLVYTD